MAGLSPEEVVELKHGMAGIAEVTWTFYKELIGQGFAAPDALRLTAEWLNATVRGSMGGGTGD